ncbi:jg10451 [Pararge aegeria aegeria]|uniref:Jg10451 protein n=1 Tax=Pararge aegeria aegeria TaxID=348720 RepID=A0A8S4RG13_9NEOP|nr:jg10451 [Pararge aegeria aegeria]
MAATKWRITYFVMTATTVSRIHVFLHDKRVAVPVGVGVAMEVAVAVGEAIAYIISIIMIRSLSTSHCWASSIITMTVLEHSPTRLFQCGLVGFNDYYQNGERASLATPRQHVEDLYGAAVSAVILSGRFRAPSAGRVHLRI